ncbi:Guanine nucleotide-binding protein alpha-2 subunit [Tulasnella sp. JGI-2019a]|nr:Guanine nucleotide-binding protein alpha-2 subunit [Tulasnella sp. JGI-2019a]
MGACLSSSEFVNEAEKSAIKRSKVIDKSLEIEKHQRAKDFKILLLGAGESGKSTVVKQMKIIHNGGYTPEELEFFRPIVYKNLLDAAQLIILAMKKLGVDYADNRNRLPRIRANDYVPTETDVLRARAKTSGIMETHFKLGPELSIRMYDVGGQRSERKKWIHCFENVTSIIFCVALSEYDQVLLEEASQNRMDESLILFESVINSRWFQRTSMILFLNKIDVFKEKLRKSPMERHFPEYTGGQDISKAAKYILWRFHMVNRAKLAIYPHLTQATDTSNIKLVTAAVKETLLRNALDESGVI